MAKQKADVNQIFGIGVLVDVRIEEPWEPKPGAKPQEWRKITASVNVAEQGAKEHTVRVTTIRGNLATAKELRREYKNLLNKRVSIWGGLSANYSETKDTLYTNIMGILNKPRDREAAPHVTFKVEGKVVAFIKHKKLIQVESNAGYRGRDDRWIDRVANNFFIWRGDEPFSKNWIGKYVLVTGNGAGKSSDTKYDKAIGAWMPASVFGPFVTEAGIHEIAGPKKCKKVSIDAADDDDDETPVVEKLTLKKSKKVKLDTKKLKDKGTKSTKRVSDENDNDENDDDNEETTKPVKENKKLKLKGTVVKKAKPPVEEDDNDDADDDDNVEDVDEDTEDDDVENDDDENDDDEDDVNDNIEDTEDEDDY